MTDHQRDILREALDQMERMRGLVWGPEWMEEVAAALRAMLDENADLKERIDRAYEDIALDQRTNETLRAELAALKKADPIAEMWRELAEYQPQADRDGHGESWRIMCEERTAHAADGAASAADARAAYAVARATRATRAAWAAQAAVAEASRSARFAADAIAAIRRAKEAKP